MPRKYFEKPGWEGLSAGGKFKAVVIGLIGMGITYAFLWLAFPKGIPGRMFLISAVVGFLAGAVASVFLPRDTYYVTEYFCADCNQFLGYSPAVCDRCGCNRYTTQDTGGAGRTIRHR